MKAATLLILLALTGCGKSFELQSTAFGNNEPIPEKYWYNPEGKDISIPVNWVNPPSGTQSFVLVIHFLHYNMPAINWAVINIPASCSEIAENASGNNMPEGSAELINYQRKPGYYGPEPRRRIGTFEYKLVVYALNTVINDIDRKMTFDEINAILDGKILAKSEITGTATRN